MSDNVRPFPTRPLNPDELDELRAMFTRRALTVDELVHGPLDAIEALGPWVLNPDAPAAETVRRIAAIAGALTGGGAVHLPDGATALHVLVAQLKREATT